MRVEGIRGPGGWGWVVPDGPWANGFDRRHDQPAHGAAWPCSTHLRTIEGPVEVVSDSTYVVNCFRDGWWKGWLKRDWKNSKKEPVANRDLWEPLIELYRGREDEIAVHVGQRVTPATSTTTSPTGSRSRRRTPASGRTGRRHARRSRTA